ncbi:MAG: S1/P1 Nuclease [Bacteroidetes bacterium MedPE-SWsnd-G1]|nr:MAG: S1/P1 Nuclease [Bacteroidetes bacterium MedPE-SWsnd-G1]
MRENRLLVLGLVVLLALPLTSYKRWGQTGHRVVGEIAQKHLTKKASKAIDKLLDGKSLAFVSTYADEIKSDKKYNKYYTWHYINMDMNQDYAAAEKNPKGDLVSGIAKCKQVISDENASKEDKAFHLKMLVHLVGDLHQPMHIGLKEDKGGNDFKVKWFYKDSNLHRVWDSDMIDGYSMSYIELAENADRLSKNQVAALQQGTVVDWVNEVHELTKEVYGSAEQGENLRYRYSYEYLETARTQMQKGGIRLAKVLNDLF